jgi:RTX calcium-binding nonapeptide repeat (4 copies)
MTRKINLAAGATALAATLPAILATPIAGAQSPNIDGVRAVVNHGTLVVKGGDQDNRIALRLAAGDPGVIQVDVGDDGSPQFSFARSDIGAINLRGGDGNDSLRIDDANGAFTNTIPTTISGGDGNDSLEGGQTQIAAENETYYGGDGNDRVDGGKGADTAYLGDGDDTFKWDNGEGSDVVEGQDGHDTMVFNGAGINETVSMTAKDGRLNFFRVQGNVLMDTDGVEQVDDNTFGGSDSVTIGDLSGTDVTQTNIDLGGADNAVDNVVVNGNEGDDHVAVNGAGTGVDVTGLANSVSIRRAEPTDNLAVNTLPGNDQVLTNGTAGVMNVKVNGATV